jgi:hypothetical protein
MERHDDLIIVLDEAVAASVKAERISTGAVS